MMVEKPVFYEVHPVSDERRAALLAAGYLIIDAVFQPEGYENPPDPQADERPSEKGLTVAQLREELAALGVSVPADAKKADLEALLEAELAKRDGGGD
ncbi:HeH/LEM domain-containing protein [Neisseria elongata]|uniref:HeH/LEM domain-containing protein n=1 Tax=Neisseria elongata TaxID=495 RepID=UPI0030C66893